MAAYFETIEEDNSREPLPKRFVRFLQRSNKKTLYSAVSMLLLVIALPLIVIGGVFQNQDNRQRAAEVSPSEIQLLTQQLLDANINLNKQGGLGAMSTEDAIQNMENLAQQRKEKILNEITIKNNAQILLQNAIAPNIRKILPPTVQPYIEEKHIIEGVIVTGHADMLDGSVQNYYRLENVQSINDGAKTNYRLYFTDTIPALRSGQVIQTEGYALDSNFVPSVKINNSPISSQSPQEGEHKAIVFLVSFQNTPFPYSLAEMRDLIFGSGNSLNSYYKKNSNNKISFSGTINGYTIPSTGQGNCVGFFMPDQWRAEANELAYDRGLDVQSFDNRIYIYAEPNGCSKIAGGLGSIGGLQPISDIYSNNKDYILSVLAHEIGHNLGNHHANMYSCGGGCASHEYYDLSDVMGFSRSVPNYLPEFNAPHKAYMGWIPSNQITTILAPGIYKITLNDLEGSSSGTKIVKIRKQEGTTTGSDAWYYISYRKDPQLPLGYTWGANIHFFSEKSMIIDKWTALSRTQLIDTTDQIFDVNVGPEQFVDPALADGKIFNDDSNPHILTIKQLSHTPNTAAIEINYSPKFTAAYEFTPPREQNEPEKNVRVDITVQSPASSELHPNAALLIEKVDFSGVLSKKVYPISQIAPNKFYWQSADLVPGQYRFQLIANCTDFSTESSCFSKSDLIKFNDEYYNIDYNYCGYLERYNYSNDSIELVSGVLTPIFASSEVAFIPHFYSRGVWPVMLWEADGGTFDGTEHGVFADWIAPSLPGTYTVSLSLDGVKQKKCSAAFQVSAPGASMRINDKVEIKDKLTL